MRKICQLATIPVREVHLKKAVESLLPQMDEIYVMLNGHPRIPQFLKRPRITINLLRTNLGDQMKFLDINIRDSEYLFTCDDDLVYPPDYSEYMISKIEEHGAAVTLHGKNYCERKLFLRPKETFHCLNDVLADQVVQVGGTGVMAWKRGMIRINHADCYEMNMSDLYFARQAIAQGVKIVVAAHRSDYLKHLPVRDTIFRRTKARRGVVETKVLRSFL